MLNTTSAPLPTGYALRPGYPPIPDYCHLRAASGLTPKTPAQAAPIARHSWYGCYVTYSPDESSTASKEENRVENSKKGKEEIVAMGRIIGDGGWYFLIADMATLPDHQRKGLGDAVLKHLLGYIKENAPGGSYVTLFADGPGRRLYARNGFVGSMPEQMGMALPIGWEESW